MEPIRYTAPEAVITTSATPTNPSDSHPPSSLVLDELDRISISRISGGAASLFKIAETSRIPGVGLARDDHGRRSVVGGGPSPWPPLPQAARSRGVGRMPRDEPTGSVIPIPILNRNPLAADPPLATWFGSR